MYLGIFISAMTLCTDIFHCAFCFLYDGTSCKGRLQVIFTIKYIFRYSNGINEKYMYMQCNVCYITEYISISHR